MSETAPTEARPAERFLVNVLWNWAGAAVQLAGGVVISPLIIRKLGADRYGVWALVFSMMSYYGLTDFGVRSAVVRYSAHYREKGESGKINELVNTTFFYYSLVCLFLLGVTVILWQFADRLFLVQPTHREEFRGLILVVGASLAVGMNFGVFSGVVEGFQRFDLSNRIRIVVFALRLIGWFLLLIGGYGLVAMGCWGLLTTSLFFGIYYILFRRIFPEHEFARRHVKFEMFKETAGYGAHTFIATIGTKILDQAPSLLIGRFQGTAHVGYFNFPLRLVQYGAEAISNVGLVAAPRSASLAARGERETVARLGIYANRYCLTLYMPMALFVVLYGGELFRLWLRPGFAEKSAPLLPVLFIGYAVGQAAQFCSSSILFGLGKQAGYAYAVFTEGMVSVATMIYVIPRHGILGAAVAGSVLMLLNRGVLTPWLLCHHLEFPYSTYMAAILVRPLAVAAPVMAILYWLKRWGVAGNTWGQLILAATVTVVLYFGLAYFFCLEKKHRHALVAGVLDRLWRKGRQTGRKHRD